MASPFHIFRKHQRAMLVVVGILCMIGFSIAGVIDYSGSTRSGEDPVVATAYGKNIRSSEVQQMLRRRVLAINFMAQCKAAEYNLPDFAQLFANTYEREAFGPATEEDVVRAWVLGERARQMGMVVDDDAINAFIRDQTENKVKADAMRAIVQRLGVGAPQVFEALRSELLAKRLRDMALGGMQVTPAQRWDYYRRQKQQATVEVVPIRVEDFIGEVPDAPDEDLRAFFDAHKEQEPNPESPLPGFKVPKRAAFEVVIAKFSDFLDPSAVTEEEIKEQYEKAKDARFPWDESALEDQIDEPGPATEEEPTQTSEENPEEKKAGEGAAGDNTGGEPKESEDGSAPKPGEKGRSSSMSPKRTIAGLIAHPAAAVAGLLAADDADPSAAGTKPADQPAGAKDAVGKGSNATTTAKPAEAEETGEAKKSSGAPSGEKAGSEKSPGKKIKLPPLITSENVLPRDIRQGPRPKYAPLWQVEDAIRDELARKKANEKIEEALRFVREKMRAYTRSLGPDDAEVKMPDLAKVAAAQHLSVVETGQVSELELREKFPEIAEAHGDQRNIPFSYIAFNAMGKLQNTTVQDLETNRYLVWKIDEQDAYVPDFADVRSKVLRVWKITKARDLAVKRAKELAEEANKAQKPLKELFASREGLSVVQTAPFSWLTRGTANVDNRAPPKISEVEGVESPGPDFMREVFNLGVGASGEAMNAPQTIAYVVRLMSLEPSRERLRPAFLSDSFALYNEVAREDMGEVLLAWIKGLEAEAQLTWKNPEAKRR
ncbi:MAG TPA: SurA N-terminal domain-containing protein [Pirellulales bacterium]|nr:SurA N-terminal domain-containing protein [Pirellulales bacterium]